MNYHKGFVPILLIIIAALVVGGGYIGYTQTKQIENQNANTTSASSTQTPTEFTEGTGRLSAEQIATIQWKTYVNPYYHYSLIYPPDAQVILAGIGFDGSKWIEYSLADKISSTTAKRASTCVSISDKSWYLNINVPSKSSEPCGTTSKVGKRFVDETLVAGKPKAVEGFVSDDYASGTFSFDLNDQLSIEYGVTAQPQAREQFVALVDSIGSILEHIQITQ